MKTLKEIILESVLRHGNITEGRDPNYGKFPIYGKLSDTKVRTKPALTKPYLIKKFKSLGAKDATTKGVCRADKDSADAIIKFLKENGFRVENDLVKQQIYVKPDETVKGYFVKDQKTAIDINGKIEDGKFVSEWPYPDNGPEERTLVVTTEVAVAILGRNSPFDEEQIWFIHTWAPGVSNLEKDAKSGAYRFSFKRDVKK